MLIISITVALCVVSFERKSMLCYQTITFVFKPLPSYIFWRHTAGATLSKERERAKGREKEKGKRERAMMCLVTLQYSSRWYMFAQCAHSAQQERDRKICWVTLRYSSPCLCIFCDNTLRVPHWAKRERERERERERKKTSRHSRVTSWNGGVVSRLNRIYSFH